ncbi:MAG TPA: TIR domain-containing protein [Vicinamibacterales bacterium]|nr:TIR domain-containing protein [Vicinamibacterales bacterium]
MQTNPYRSRGAMVSDDEFIGRSDILAECLALITGGELPQNISIYGDKWSGKTWLLRTIQKRLRESVAGSHEQVCIYLDVQGVGTPRTFYGRLNGELAAALRDPASRIDDTSATLTECVRRIAARARTIVILDGFDSITRNPMFPVEFFGFLRSLPLAEPRFAWLLSSTRPLREMCHSAAVQGSPFFNIFSDRLLGAFTSEDSYQLIVGRSISAGRSLQPYADQLQRLAGRFPLFLQMACSYAFEQHQEHNGLIDLAGVSQKLREEVRPYVQHLWSRLSPAEREVLERVGIGAPVGSQPMKLLHDLVRRGYLVGPSLESGLFAFDCDALVELLRQTATSGVAATACGPSAAVAPVNSGTRAASPDDRRIRVFISYSHRNKRAFKQIFDYICSLSKDVEFWFDSRLKAGDIWDERIRTEISKADIALVLASQEYFTSSYCMEVEAAEFVRARVAAGMVIFPVVLSPCPIDDHDWLFKTHRLPREGTYAQVASTKARRDALLMQILNDLRSVAQDIRARRREAAAT